VALLDTHPKTTGARVLYECLAVPSSGLAADVREQVATRVRSTHAVDSDGVEIVMLVVSELVSNACRAANHLVLVRLSKTDRSLLVEVEDDGPGRPQILEPGPDETSGRGLLIVDRLAQQVGVVPVSGDRKRVWASVDSATPLPRVPT
jgi:anti-sigma regulatory factor (Ser/Thr protein kinase)